MAEVEIRKVTGKDLATYLDELAALRIEVFRDFPYLYDGDLGYEKEYLQTYVKAAGSAAFLVFDENEVVGASTCLPLSEETDELKAPFSTTQYSLDEVLYLGESVLRPAYRGRGIGVEFFRLREEHGRLLNKKYASFCAVQRPKDHPLRPNDYRPLDDFWKKRGYHALPGVKTRLKWKDVNEPQETEKQLMYWIKRLDQPTTEG
ncbi:MAG: GNAT family N-acetyltransferase [Cyclobacteriaceae bacterium]